MTTEIRGATAEQFTKWQKEAKAMSNDSLQYVIKDCREAEKAMSTWNPEKECFYADQAMTFADELNSRNIKG